jgi:heat-inducible transcriptional repressor
MSDLEEMEFFYQPHASAGRLPTAKAYRLYVDSIMQRSRLRPRETEEWREDLNNRRMGIEGVLSHVTRMLSSLTDYVGVAAVSGLENTVIHRIDFVPMGGEAVMLLIVLQGGLVYHGQFSLSYQIGQEALEELARCINTVACGRQWSEVREILYDYVFNSLENMEAHCRSAIQEIERLMSSNNYRFFSSGAQRILKLPDAHDISYIQAVLSLLEEEKPLAEVVERCRLDHEVKVTIGGENNNKEMRESSMILVPAATSGQSVVLGLIGPVRMDYERSISVLEGMAFAMQDNSQEPFPAPPMPERKGNVKAKK